MYKYLEKENELSFHNIFNQIIGTSLSILQLTLQIFLNIFFLGYLLFKDFCENDSEEPIQQLKFYEQVSYL